MKTIRNNLFVISVIAAAFLIASSAVRAGDLNPPAPPMAGTMKTLDQVEPRIPIPASSTPAATFLISQSGSYYLTGNRRCSETGIEVNADDVTIDLAGYALIGPDTGPEINGVAMPSRRNVEIRNGTVKDFKRGIFGSGTCQNLRAINVRALSNTSLGIYFTGSNHLVKDCTVSGNGYDSPAAWPYGIYVGRNSIVSGNTVEHTADSIATTAATVHVYSIKADAGSTITGNTSSNNGNGAAATGWYVYVYGISAGDNCTVTGNTASNNGTSTSGSCIIYGIVTGSGCTVSGNTANNNGTSVDGTGLENARVYGIATGTGCLVADNTAFYNGSSNTAYVFIYGILTGDGNTVRGNTASYNGEFSGGVIISGIQTSTGCTVIGNTAYQNGNSINLVGDGINLGGLNFVDQNTAIGNYGTNMTSPGSGLITANNFAP